MKSSDAGDVVIVTDKNVHCNIRILLLKCKVLCSNQILLIIVCLYESMVSKMGSHDLFSRNLKTVSDGFP